MLKKWLIGFLTILIIVCCTNSFAFAGDINGAEQKIVSFYNGTVAYNGKFYVFTESAKQQAYNKLIQDDVNLTDEQAEAAILQAKANYEQGIAQGYMVEAGNTAETPEGENPPQQGTEIPPEEIGSVPPQETVPSQETIPSQEVDQPNQETITLPPQETDSSQGTVSNQKDTSSKKEERPSYSDTKKTDISTVFEEILSAGEYAEITTNSYETEEGHSGWTAAGADLQKGELIVAAENGDVLLETSLPVKNTGYAVIKILPAAMIVFLFGTVLAVFFCRRKGKYILVPMCICISICFGTAAFGSGVIKSAVEKYYAIWTMDTVEYAYEEKSAQKLPIKGEQYGEIICEEAGLKVPLYYGDSEEILAKGAGTYTGLSLPGEMGEVLIGGHDGTYFAALEKIREKSKIQIKTSYGNYIYEVTETLVADVREYEMQSGAEAGLTLYTCYPFGEESTERTQRFFVYAKQISNLTQGGSDEK